MQPQTARVLYRPGRIRARIRDRREEIMEINADCQPRAITYDRPRVRSYRKTDRIEQMAIILAAKEKDLEKLRRTYQRAVRELKELLDNMEGSGEIAQEERTILLMRYVDARPFREIAQELHKCEATIYRKHRSGIRALETRLDNPTGENVEN